MSDNKKLLTEIERQQKYLDELPEQFSFPLFNSRKALESQRQSGYRTTAAATRELVDNAIEAGASRVHAVFDRPADGRSKKRKNRVSAIAVIDDGSGMLPQMARFALSWGGGTHFDEHEFIGKFGFGLPNASINQARQVTVYTRTAPSEPIWMANLDIDDYKGEGSSQDIGPCEKASLPEFVESYLLEHDWAFERGTVVVWSKPDRLSYKKASSLREHILDDFGVTYRYLLKDVELVVEGTKVQKVDPLFLEPDARFYLRPEDGGAVMVHEAPIPVALIVDAEGERHLRKVEQSSDLEGADLLTAGAINVRVARFPLGLVVGRKGEGRIQPVDEHAKNRFEIRKTRRGMSFVRAGREIETVDVFPRRESDKASGLGDWPLLQAYAYHWGIEVSFTPSLDDVFGITNDKQTVRPIEDFWRLLAEDEVDELLHREQKWQSDKRAEHRVKAIAEAQVDDSKATPAEQAAKAADVAVGDTPQVPDRSKPDASQKFEEKVQQQSRTRTQPIEEARKALEDVQRFQPYDINYIDEEHGPFYVPEWIGRQVVVKINRSHAFYKTLYSSLLDLEGGALAKAFPMERDGRSVGRCGETDPSPYNPRNAA